MKSLLCCMPNGRKDAVVRQATNVDYDESALKRTRKSRSLRASLARSLQLPLAVPVPEVLAVSEGKVESVVDDESVATVDDEETIFGQDLEGSGAVFSNGDCLVGLVPQSKKKMPKRHNAHIICVIDNSGSMCEDAAIQNESGVRETSGLSVLDLVKHSIRVTMSMLGPKDMISVVIFNSEAEIICKMVKCDAKGKKMVQDKLDGVHPYGMTNIWDGLKEGLKIAKEGTLPGYMTSMFVLTDGEPNVEPPRGYVVACKNYIEEKFHNELPCAIHTFGFGYHLNTKLLREYARIGGGSYSFIPDAGMVGTVFIHAISNCLATFAQDLELTISFEDGTRLNADAEVNRILQAYDSFKLSDEVIVRLGSIQFGQQRSLLLSLLAPFKFTGTITYTLCGGVRKTAEIPFTAAKDSLLESTTATRNRQALISCVYQIVEHLKGSRDRSESEITRTVNLIMQKETDAMAKSLLDDLQGQVSEAVIENYYSRWGRHYLPSLLCAHALQTCNNFKDPGVQSYTTSLFSKLRTEAEAQFEKVDPPKPSNSPGTVISNSKMRHMYLNVLNGCFAGSCQVLMANGSYKLVRDIQAGDVVAAPGNERATVQCVIQTTSPDTDMELLRLKSHGDLTITPYHPIRLENGKWVFPCELEDGPVEIARLDSHYNFVLDSQHIMIINSVECVTLGHNFRNDPVVSHPYFGTDKILQDLMMHPAWVDGHINLAKDSFLRDPITQLIYKLNI